MFSKMSSDFKLEIPIEGRTIKGDYLLDHITSIYTMWGFATFLKCSDLQ